jgi:two-component system sensor histidine kinase AlgZ
MLVGEAFALILALAPGRSEDPLVYFGLASFLVQWALIGTLCVAYALREPLSRAPLRLAIWALPAILVAAAGAVGAGVAGWSSLGGHHDDFSAYVLQFMGIALVAGVVGTTLLIALMDLQEQRVRAEQAESDALRARVRPHFLFNTLNTAIGLVKKSPDQAEDVLLALSDLFRASLAGHREWGITDEIAITRSYLAIEQARLNARLTVEWRGEPPRDRRIPTLLLQSLVENAIQHGIEPLREGGVITIEFAADGQDLVIRVSNPVSTAPPKERIHRGHRIGLAATEERLARLQPIPGRLLIERGSDHFVAAAVLPAPPQATTR